MDGSTYARIISDTEGIKYRTWVSGDHHYFRNYNNDNSCLMLNDLTVRGGPGTNTQLGHTHHTGYAAITYKGRNGEGDYMILGGNSGDLFMNVSSGKNMYFRENNDSKMTLNATGLGIGVAPNHKLHVAGNIVSTGWMYMDYARLSTAPGGATAGEVRLGETGGVLDIQSEFGYLEAGPKNSSHCHFYTDRTNFYFDKELRVKNGNFCI